MNKIFAMLGAAALMMSASVYAAENPCAMKGKRIDDDVIPPPAIPWRGGGDYGGNLSTPGRIPR